MRDRLDRRLAVRGRVADVLAAWRLHLWETALQRRDDRGGVVDGQRGLREEGEVRGVGGGEALGILDRLDQRHRAFRDLAERADHLGMPGMADEHDVPPLRDQPLGLAVHLGYQRTGRIEIFETTRLRVERYRFGNAVRREHDRRIVGHLAQILDEHRALRLERVDDELVVDDLVTDIDGCAMLLDRQLDDADRTVDAGAEAAWCRDQQFERGFVAARRRGNGCGVCGGLCGDAHSRRALRDCLPGRKPVPMVRGDRGRCDCAGPFARSRRYASP